MGLRVARAVHALGKVTNGVTAQRHVLNHTQYPHSGFGGQLGAGSCRQRVGQQPRAVWPKPVMGIALS